MRSAISPSYVVTAMLIVACGGRSQLGDGSSSGGVGSAGGATSTGSTASSSSSSTSTASSSSGNGGAPQSCNGLTLSGERITYEPTPMDHGSRPILVPATDDGSLVSVVFAQAPVESPSDPPIAVAGATFAPWGMWPSSLGPTARVVGFGGDAFATARSPAADQPGFSVLFYLPTDSFPSDMYLAPAAAGKSYDPFPQGISWDAWEPAWGVALARGASGHLAAYEVGMGADAFLSVAFVGGGSPTPFVIDEVACANAPFTADVAEVEGGYLLATAAGRKFGACPLDDGIPGPAKDLHVIRVDQATKQVSLAASFEGTDPLTHVALARRAQGAWVVWQENGASALTPPPIQAALLDETGAVAGPVFPIPATMGTLGPFAAAALGPNLVVAWVEAFDPSTPTLRLEVFSEAGTYLSSASINTAPSWLYDASLSLLPSPDGTQLLMAWADEASPEQAMVRVVRFSCTGIGE